MIAKLSIAKLCEWLDPYINEELGPPVSGSTLLREATNRLLVAEVCRRLSLFAPVRIDPEDESTWPTDKDYVLARVPSRWDHGEWDMEPCVEVYGHSESAPCWGLLEKDHAAWIDEFTHWRRIDNTPPE